MRSLRITLHTSHSVILPLAYNELLQGLLYDCWKGHAPQLHDFGFVDGSATYRLFTYGPLRGKGRIDSKRRTYQIEDVVSFEVRSPVEELLDILAEELAGRGNARIGAHTLDVVNLESCDRLLFPKRAVIHMVQPIVAQHKLDDGHTEYLSPDDEDWLRHIQDNATGKVRAAGLSIDTTLQLIPLSGSNTKKQVTRFKKTYVTGWKGDYALSCNPQLMQLLYSCGLGSKNSQGFGMFDIDNRPL